jgi:biopolymer transport protein ExbD
MSASVQGPVAATPNLTPLLDMVFQLITFFMLVINFKSAELDQTLILPVVGSARPVPAGSGPVLVLNVRVDKDHPNGCLVIYNSPHDNIDGYIANESEVELLANKMTKDDIHEGGKELPTLIILRADETTPFHVVNHVITCCQENGYRKFALKTRMLEKKK